MASPSPTVPLPTSLLLLLFLLSITTTTTTNAQVPSNQTFTYVNQGEFGPYITEYDAGYRTLPIFRSPFQFCFYNTTPDAFFLALRMATRRSESLFRWVWEANRGRPVGENATLSFLSNGNLVLADADGRVAWSTNISNKGVVGLSLLPTGNLVLYNAKGKYIWQSFDHPTDTLLVGQSLYTSAGKGPTTLTSRASAVDGSSGAYSLVLGSTGVSLYINNVTSQPLRYGFISIGSGGVTSVKLTSTPETDEAYSYEVGLEVAGGGGTALLARPKYNATLSILRLQIDGNLVVYTYYDPVDYRAWERTYAYFDEQLGSVSACALPGKCGALGVCVDEMCVGCPTRKGVVGWSDECRPPPAAGCGGGGAAAGYYEVGGVESFLTGYEGGEAGVTAAECKRRCSGDCGCKGVMFWEKEKRCWLAPLIGTLSKVDNATHVAYIKYPTT